MRPWGGTRRRVRRPLGLRVPVLQIGKRIERPAAVVPARRGPLLEMQVAAVGAPRIADEADQLPRPDPVARIDERRLPQVHVGVVDTGPLAVDHQVVAGTRVVLLELHLAAPGGHDRRPARGEDVLALMAAPAPEGRGALAVLVRAGDREAVAE